MWSYLGKQVRLTRGSDRLNVKQEGVGQDGEGVGGSPSGRIYKCKGVERRRVSLSCLANAGPGSGLVEEETSEAGKLTSQRAL